MSVESALHNYLGGVVGVTNLLGSGTAFRLYPDLAPAGPTRPYATMFVVSTTRDRRVTGPGGIARANVQVDAWAETSLSRATVAEALRVALDGFRGAMGSELLDVRAVIVDGPFNSMERPEDASEEPIYRARMSVQVIHAESIPTF